ncbi:MAG: TIR domain-containing protein [Chitinispirillaceae bacterium]|nr:TIR domain-containing protein [Chitinispirillaceae bacterium]
MRTTERNIGTAVLIVGLMLALTIIGGYLTRQFWSFAGFDIEYFMRFLSRNCFGIVLATSLVLVRVNWRGSRYHLAAAAGVLLLTAQAQCGQWGPFCSGEPQIVWFGPFPLHSGTLALLLLLPLLVHLIFTDCRKKDGWKYPGAVAGLTVAVNGLLLLQPDTAMLLLFNATVLYMVLVSRMPGIKITLALVPVVCGVVAILLLVKFNPDYNEVVYDKASAHQVRAAARLHDSRNCYKSWVQSDTKDRNGQQCLNKNTVRYELLAAHSTLQMLWYEFGGIGVAILCGVYAVLAYVMWAGCRKIRDENSREVARVLLFILIFLAIAHITRSTGVVRLVPFIPMPFAGYGGYWTVSCWLVAGVYLRVLDNRAMNKFRIPALAIRLYSELYNSIRIMIVPENAGIENGYEYDAFISYRHVDADREYALWLVNALEMFRTPLPLVKKGTKSRLTKVFRDEDELPTSANLKDDITRALSASNFLVVICSPATPQSRWVNQEVVQFREMGRGHHIIPLLIEGSPEESFPPALRALKKVVNREDGTFVESDEDVEPLFADVRPRSGESVKKLRSMALLRIVAQVLGCSFDELRQRERQRRIRRLWQLAAVIGAVLFLVAGGIFAW